MPILTALLLAFALAGVGDVPWWAFIVGVVWDFLNARIVGVVWDLLNAR